ncbi:hypothetical protein HJC23_010306 [Cyclotella cryptica]|uniref:Uncharacterized protein n=1 Tax=Cyclotella cryptica TaxID=29204 RepID=A0ABD3QP69_9STRA
MKRVGDFDRGWKSAVCCGRRVAVCGCARLWLWRALEELWTRQMSVLTPLSRPLALASRLPPGSLQAPSSSLLAHPLPQQAEASYPSFITSSTLC